MRLLIFLILLIVIWWLIRTNRIKMRSLIIAVGAIILTAYAVLIFFGGFYNWQKESVPNDKIVSAFIQEMNPELHQKIDKIRAEIALSETKIKQLHALKKSFPNQEAMIEQKLEQWHNLTKQLNQVLNDIALTVEKAYVAYKINEIQGENQFRVISKALLKEANAVLANADATKSIIEEPLYE
jgi:uncharacterized protein YukE